MNTLDYMLATGISCVVAWVTVHVLMGPILESKFAEFHQVIENLTAVIGA